MPKNPTLRERLDKLETRFDDKVRTVFDREFKLTRDEIILQSERISKAVNDAKNELRTTATQIFENATFVDKFQNFIIRLVEQEIKTQIRNNELHNLVGSLVQEKIKDKFGDAIRTVVSEIVEQMNKKLDAELKLTKELTYSIDSQIRHTMAHIPVSYQSEQIIKEKIMDTVSKAVKKGALLEHKDRC